MVWGCIKVECFADLMMMPAVCLQGTRRDKPPEELPSHRRQRQLYLPASQRRRCLAVASAPHKANRGAPVRFGAHFGQKRNEKYDNKQRQRQGERRPAIAAAAGVLGGRLGVGVRVKVARDSRKPGGPPSSKSASC